jgi:hypothetical protein
MTIDLTSKLAAGKDDTKERHCEVEEELPEDDPQKHQEGRFSEGQSEKPPGYTP